MSDNNVDTWTGEVCDALDELISRLESEGRDNVSHLYVARHLLLNQLEQRPYHSRTAAIAGLSAVEDALQRAHDDLSDTEDAPAAERTIERIHHQVTDLREAHEEVELNQLGWRFGSDEKWNYDRDELALISEIDGTEDES